MKRTHLARLVLLLLILAAAALAGTILLRTGSDTVAPVEEASGRSALAIRGFDVATWDGDRLRTRATADLLRIRPRRLGIFKVRSLNEVILYHARFEIHPGNVATARTGVLQALGGQVASRLRTLPGMEGVGTITRAVLAGGELVFMRRGETGVIARGPKGEISFDRRQVRLEDAVLEHPRSGRRIASETIVWDEERREFHIPGSYEATTPTGRARGRAIRVDLDFHVERLPLAGS